MISVNYLENIKQLNLDSDITNGDLQNKILNTFHLCVYDIKYILLKYTNMEHICGDNEMSFYSKFQSDNLIEAVVVDKNSTSLESRDIDSDKLREYFNTYLISLNDEIYIGNSPSNVEIEPFDIGIESFDIDIDRESSNNIESENENETESSNNIETESSNNIENESSNNIENENESSNNIENESFYNIDTIAFRSQNLLGNVRIYRNIPNVSNIPNVTSLNIMEYILRNTLIRAVNDELIATQEDVKIVSRKTDFDNIEVISNFEEDINCSICLEPMNTNVIQVKCGHYYHKECGKKWFCECSNKCPVCKIEISDGIPLE